MEEARNSGEKHLRSVFLTSYLPDFLMENSNPQSNKENSDENWASQTRKGQSEM